MQGWLSFLGQLFFCPVLWPFDWAGAPVYTESMKWALRSAYLTSVSATVTIFALRFFWVRRSVCTCAGLSPSPGPEAAPAPGITWGQGTLLAFAVVMAWLIPSTSALQAFNKDDLPQRGKDTAEVQQHLGALLQLQQSAVGEDLLRWRHLLGAIITRLQHTVKGTKLAEAP